MTEAVRIATTVLFVVLLSSCGKRGGLPAVKPWLLQTSVSKIEAEVAVFEDQAVIKVAGDLAEIKMECIAQPPEHALGDAPSNACTGQPEKELLKLPPGTAAFRLHKGDATSPWYITHRAWAERLAGKSKGWSQYFEHSDSFIPATSETALWQREAIRNGDVIFYGAAHPVTNTE